MNEEDAVEPQLEHLEEIMEAPETEAEVEVQDEVSGEDSEKAKVPLHVVQKLRDKKKEIELELQWQKQKTAELEAAMQKQQLPKEDDSSKYESATRADLSQSQMDAVRIVEERLWIRQNPEKFEMVSQNLEKFLQQRPNLRSAIKDSFNRYEEAYDLMTNLNPQKQQPAKTQSQPKKEAPNSPGGVPKAAAMNEAVDVMNMSDQEFSAWRASKRKRR